jgi:hypothetical protein
VQTPEAEYRVIEDAEIVEETKDKEKEANKHERQ